VSVSTCSVAPVTSKNKEAFFRLIQEQAIKHGAEVEPCAVDRLSKAIGSPNGTNAFLVVVDNGRDSKEVVGAVTYFMAIGLDGPTMYLDDIVTEIKFRGKGVGSFALMSLARIARCTSFKDFICSEFGLANKASVLMLECMKKNDDARRFYEARGGKPEESYRTWRKLKALNPAKNEITGPTSDVNVHPMTQADVESVKDFFESKGNQIAANSLCREWVLNNSDFKLAVVKDAAQTIIGVGTAYRSYSTFRQENGLHVSSMTSKDLSAEEKVAHALLNYYAQIQQREGWTGHFDVTFDETDSKLTAVFNKFGIAPLSYGSDEMISYRFSKRTLEKLAHSKPNPDLESNLYNSLLDPQQIMPQYPESHHFGSVSIIEARSPI